MDLPRLTIAIPTYRRPERLATNLQHVSLRALEAVALADISILVVDNDPEGSARDSLDSSAGLPIDYVVEPTPGIAAARNRALAESKGSRLLAFIDDDETPQPDWLASLVRTWRTTGADAVAGRVVTTFPDNVDQWLIAGGVLSRPSRQSGTVLSTAATGNILLDLATIRRLELTFDDSLGLAGGEDTIFTTELTRAGGLIVWCQESVTHDPLPPERATRSWARRRAFSHGNTLVDTRIRLATSPIERSVVRTRAIVGGAARVLVGGGRLAAGTVARNLSHQVRGQRFALRGLGMFVGGFGHRHHEYRRPSAIGDKQ